MNSQNNLILYSKGIAGDRAKRLYNEFQQAWFETSSKEQLKWCKDSIKLFGKVTFRRSKGFFKVTKNLVKKAGYEAKDIGVAFYNKEGVSHLKNKKNDIILYTKEGYQTSKKAVLNFGKILRKKPKEAGPILFLGVLGFFCGAGFSIGDKKWYDIDGGIPDLDWELGELTDIELLQHRSIFTHSVISAAVIETMVFSSISAINMIHSKLPKHHDPLWNKVLIYNDWGRAFATGACTGIAYHLLLDGTLDGGGHYSGLPSMPQWAHQAIAVSNAAAETIDIKEKKILIRCEYCDKSYYIPNIGAGKKLAVYCNDCEKKFITIL